MEKASNPDKGNAVKLDEFINFRLSKADKIKLEVLAGGRSLGSTLRELIDEAYNGVTQESSELARLREKKKLLQGGSWQKRRI